MPGFGWEHGGREFESLIPHMTDWEAHNEAQIKKYGVDGYFIYISRFIAEKCVELGCSLDGKIVMLF